MGMPRRCPPRSAGILRLGPARRTNDFGVPAGERDCACRPQRSRRSRCGLLYFDSRVLNATEPIAAPLHFVWCQPRSKNLGALLFGMLATIVHCAYTTQHEHGASREPREPRASARMRQPRCSTRIARGTNSIISTSSTPAASRASARSIPARRRWRMRRVGDHLIDRLGASHAVAQRSST